MAKPRGRPAAAASRRRRRAQSEWNVESHGCAGGTPARNSRSETRLRISSAALLVNVTAKMASAGTPLAIRLAMRNVIARVLPVPAPARISTGPSMVSTASRCSGFSSSRRASICLGWLEKVCTRHRSRARRRAQTCAAGHVFQLFSAFRGSAKVNFEVQEAVILFDGHDFRNVQMRGIQKLELASQVEIKESLHRAMRSNDA